MSTKSSHPKDFAVTVGTEVYTRDGELLGSVKELAPEHFKVDAPRAKDFWLDRATISTPTEGGDGRLCLTFDHEQVDDFKLDGPFAHAASPILDAEAETYRDSREVDQRRDDWQAGSRP